MHGSFFACIEISSCSIRACFRTRVWAPAFRRFTAESICFFLSVLFHEKGNPWTSESLGFPSLYPYVRLPPPFCRSFNNGQALPDTRPHPFYKPCIRLYRPSVMCIHGRLFDRDRSVQAAAGLSPPLHLITHIQHGAVPLSQLLTDLRHLLEHLPVPIGFRVNALLSSISHLFKSGLVLPKDLTVLLGRPGSNSLHGVHHAMQKHAAIYELLPG